MDLSNLQLARIDLSPSVFLSWWVSAYNPVARAQSCRHISHMASAEVSKILTAVGKREVGVSLEKPFKIMSVELTAIGLFANTFKDVRVTPEGSGLYGCTSSADLALLL